MLKTRVTYRIEMDTLLILDYRRHECLLVPTLVLNGCLLVPTLVLNGCLLVPTLVLNIQLTLSRFNDNSVHCHTFAGKEEVFFCSMEKCIEPEDRKLGYKTSNWPTKRLGKPNDIQLNISQTMGNRCNLELNIWWVFPEWIYARAVQTMHTLNSLILTSGNVIQIHPTNYFPSRQIREKWGDFKKM